MIVFVAGINLFAPGRVQDAIAEIFSFKIGNHKRADIGLDIPKGGFGLVLKSAEEGGDDILFEIISRKCADYFFPVLRG